MSSAPLAQPDWLPIRRADLDRLGWDAVDVLLVSGDAYVDHPAFAAALLGRWLIGKGFRVGIIAQPRWDSVDDLLALGRPRLLAGVAPGAVDSMLAHYTAFRKLRHDDPNTPGGRAGARPNRAALVYTGLIRRAFPGVPVVLGGIEASLRRASHYDFWTSSLRRPLLLDAKADVLLYGMAEQSLAELCVRLRGAADNAADAARPAGSVRPRPWHGLRGAVYAAAPGEGAPAGEEVAPLPAHEEILAEPRRLMQATLRLERQMHEDGPWLSQAAGGREVLLAPPGPGLDGAELDRLYALPFRRAAHPSYREAVPALAMLKDSVTTHRGCGGGCSFCSLALHQGRRVRSRGSGSILDEVKRLAAAPGWSGSLSDLGGPSANMWNARCRRAARPGAKPCRRTSCLWPKRCPDFATDPGGHIGLMDAVRRVPGVNHARIASGIRLDLALDEPEWLAAVAADYCGGQLKIAPEHICRTVLDLMRKPGPEKFEAFLEAFAAASKRAGRRQFVVPYLMSAFPGSTDDDARRLAEWLRERGWRPRQAQCFIPTPGTVATAMFYAEIDPDGNRIFVAKTDAERLRQHGRLTGGPGGRSRPKKPRRPRPGQ